MEHNVVVISGNIGKDLEIRHTRGTPPKSVCNFFIAQDHPHDWNKPKDKKRTCWFKCRAWGKMAESLVANCAKGDKVDVQGELVQESYEVDGQTRFDVLVEAKKIRYVKVKKFDAGAGNSASRATGSNDDNLPM